MVLMVYRLRMSWHWRELLLLSIERTSESSGLRCFRISLGAVLATAGIHESEL